MKTKLLRVLALTLALLSLSLAFSACSSNPAKDLGDIVYVEIDMENGDYIKLELYPRIAPITVANFVKLCNEHFYDGIIFYNTECIKRFRVFSLGNNLQPFHKNIVIPVA